MRRKQSPIRPRSKAPLLPMRTPPGAPSPCSAGLGVFSYANAYAVRALRRRIRQHTGQRGAPRSPHSVVALSVRHIASAPRSFSVRMFSCVATALSR
jgi:hypothetical protein